MEFSRWTLLGEELLFSVAANTPLGAATLQHCSLHVTGEAVQMPRCKNPIPKRKTARHLQL